MSKWKSDSRALSCLAIGAIFSLAACSSKSQDSAENNGQNLVKATPTTNQAVQDYVVIAAQQWNAELAQAKGVFSSKSQKGISALNSLIAKRKHKKVEVVDDEDQNDSVQTTSDSGSEQTFDSLPQSSSLLLKMPGDMLNKPMIFGSVITKVSNDSDPDLGNVKLGSTPALLVKPILHKNKDGSFGVGLLLCDPDCDDETDPKGVLDIPVAGFDNVNNKVVLDVAALSKGLDITRLRKGDPTLAKYRSKSSEAILFDFSDSTLIFDVETRLALDPPPAQPEPDTVITNRWYIKSGDIFNSKFVQRDATPGVGFFLTHGKTQHIQRWDFDQRKKNQGLKYYIKNVPTEYQKAFASAFDEWNTKLKPIIGKKVFDYEFLPKGDSRNDLYVTGDVRYNVMEWDLNNVASYGGLGPSLANINTGEIFQANVLIQGPTVVKLYKKWFDGHAEVKNLEELGSFEEAQRARLNTVRELKSQISKLRTSTFQIKFGKSVEVDVASQNPGLEDPVMQRDDFDTVPAGYTYDTYIAGYFHDMVTHELGHDLGLRHNFKGNLGATAGAPVYSGVSRSIMEYLGRGYRYLDRLGEYDLMAISYGYKGIAPQHLDWYCTDEDAADLEDDSKSAECTPNDATNDPFSFFQQRLKRATDLLVAHGSGTAPQWTVEDMDSPVKMALAGLGAYAWSATKTFSTWTNFPGSSRPTQAFEVKEYVLTQLKSILCDSSLDQDVAQKGSVSAQNLAEQNLRDLRDLAADILKPVFSADELSCRTHYYLD